ncbi:uncharacterized protein LOC133291756 isoform X2 [Gastrolobium bilobum]|uniref:uncharacterized protein LOC133291756 isoform X2 n=1 Tax=Gastrolobium bilobum TaxID=150636 RepID=UPI002AB27E6E|nr:uncharacterized protein LOC133291756 isoform X2 [Gastrolobium bilobum]
MGVIKDGTISGVLPDPQGFIVHYPGYPSSISRAVDTLGGIQGILKARSSQSNKLELHFRPQDPYSHPAFGELRPSNALLLKISKRKPIDVHDANHVSRSGMENEMRTNQPEIEHKDADDVNGEANLCADIVAHVPEAYFFEGMADYQHVIPVHADVARRKKRNWSELEEPHFDKGGLMDVDHEDVMMISFSYFSLRPHTELSSKKKQEEILQPHFELDMEDTEPVLAIDFDIKDIPKKVNWEEYIPRGSDQWESQMVVSRLFDERPIWSKVSLTERLLDKGLSFSHGGLRRFLSRISYYFSSGPFLRFWIKKGYDPRKDPDSRVYQRIDYRVPVPLRSYCDNHSANKFKHRWEDICAFRAFPYKFQTSLQLFELVDDYIQSEINKPPLQATCTFGSGWFSNHMINCFRQRLMVRFLTIFPKPGAENLLRAATSRFEKMKRECTRNAMKLDGEDCQQANSGLEENEEPDNVEDDEEEAAEVNDSDEEWEEELDLGGDSEMPLPSNSYLMENISRTHLQELFGSFPSNEINGDNAQVNASDEEYHVYEEDSDDNCSDE